MQHGLYVDYTSQRNINEVNYLLHNSDNFLACGMDTKRLIKQHHPLSNVVTCGKPLQSIKRIKPKKVIAVIFDQNLFLDVNLEILEIVYSFAKANNYRVLPRLHPNNRPWRYREYFDNPLTIDCDLEGVQLAVGHTSTFLYELMTLGIPILRYNTNAPALNTNSNLEFSDVDSFSSSFESCNNIDIKNEGRKYFSHMGEESLGMYKEYFDKVSK